jgi:hypothetical protein
LVEEEKRMAFKKVTNSKTDAMFIIGTSDKSRYPAGFEYLVGRTVYTVREDVTKDTGSEMRRVTTSDGGVEIMTLESIDLDLKEPDAMVINDGQPKVEIPAPEPTPVQETKEEPKKEEEKSEYDGIEW